MAEEMKLEYYVKNAATHWWDGYTGQPVVIIDEVRAGQSGAASKEILTEFLSLLDPKDAYLGQTKGGFVPITAKIYIFTSPVHPNMWFHHADYEDDPGAQLTRRFAGIKEFKKPFAHPRAQEPDPLEASKFDELFEHQQEDD
jgi:hypothetical protein